MFILDLFFKTHLLVNLIYIVNPPCTISQQDEIGTTSKLIWIRKIMPLNVLKPEIAGF
jgi:hypothetical protein